MAVLYVVSTPIGNLEDVTLRALRILGQVHSIAAEDTRHSARLLQRYEIRKPLVSLHEHNEEARIPELLAALDLGDDLALISDAGTPTLSDPGLKLVRAAVARGHQVAPIPGPSAILAALVASGLPTDRFLFLGFPPRRQQARAALLQAAATEPGTLILFEAARRLPVLLAAIAAELGADRRVVVARELTKLHETWWRGPVAEAVVAFAEAPAGEVVVLVGGAPPGQPAAAGEDISALLAALLAGGMGPGEAARRLAAVTGLPRRQLYRLAVESVGET